MARAGEHQTFAHLRAAQVQVDGVHLMLDQLRSRQNRLRVVAAELRNERPVRVAGLEVELTVALVREEQLGVQHLREDEVGAVVPAEQAERQLAVVHHGRHHGARRPDRPPELVAVQRTLASFLLLLLLLHYCGEAVVDAEKHAAANGQCNEVSCNRGARLVPPPGRSLAGKSPGTCAWAKRVGGLLTCAVSFGRHFPKPWNGESSKW